MLLFNVAMEKTIDIRTYNTARFSLYFFFVSFVATGRGGEGAGQALFVFLVTSFWSGFRGELFHV